MITSSQRTGTEQRFVERLSARITESRNGGFRLAVAVELSGGDEPETVEIGMGESRRLTDFRCFRRDILTQTGYVVRHRDEAKRDFPRRWCRWVNRQLVFTGGTSR